MIEKISKFILSKITDENESEERKEILFFGITRIIEDIPKTIGIIIVGIILNLLKEMAVVTGVIILYKTFVGGVHSKTNLSCFLGSLMFYLVPIYSSKYLIISDQEYIYILIFIFSIYTIFTYVPADVPEIPKVDIKIRKTLKIKSTISLILIYTLVVFVIKDRYISNLIVYSVFCIDIMATRIMYRLLKNEYGFETYIPDELI